jgi:hypothetical protein
MFNVYYSEDHGRLQCNLLIYPTFCIPILSETTVFAVSAEVATNLYAWILRVNQVLHQLFNPCHVVVRFCDEKNAPSHLFTTCADRGVLFKGVRKGHLLYQESLVHPDRA